MMVAAGVLGVAQISHPMSLFGHAVAEHQSWKKMITQLVFF
jgi:hypothetical protein